MVQPSERLLTTKLAGCSMEHPYMSKCIFTLCVNYKKRSEDDLGGICALDADENLAF